MAEPITLIAIEEMLDQAMQEVRALNRSEMQEHGLPEEQIAEIEDRIACDYRKWKRSQMTFLMLKMYGATMPPSSESVH